MISLPESETPDSLDSPSSASNLSPSASSPGSSPKGELAQRFTIAPNTDPKPNVEGGKFTLASFDRQMADFDLSERKNFFMSPLPEGTFMNCFVVRKKTGLTKWSRRFEFRTDAGTLLAVSKKVGGISKKAYYLVSIDDTDMSRDGNNYAGKVRWNFKGTEFTAYDGGDNAKRVLMVGPMSPKGSFSFFSPKNAMSPTLSNRPSGEEEQDDFTDVRLQLAHVSYVVPYKGPITMEVIIPQVANGERAVVRPLTKSDPGLAELARSENQETKPTVTRFVTPPQLWREDLGHFVQNFSSRVKVPSVKNFLLVRPDDDTTYMQFGKVSEDYFVVDFGHPLSPFQAFTIALTSLDYKIVSMI